MNIQTTPESSIREAAYVVIHINDVQYMVRESPSGGLYISKINTKDEITITVKDEFPLEVK